MSEFDQSPSALPTSAMRPSPPRAPAEMDIRQLHAELQQYVGWLPEDPDRLVRMGRLVGARIPALVDDFYSQIEQHPEAARVIQGGQAQIDRLKKTLTVWLEQLFGGVYDQAFIRRRWEVGWRHVEIGLDQIYCHVAVSRLRTQIMTFAAKQWEGSPVELAELFVAFNRLMDLDLAIIDHAYHLEFLQRHERTQRLATIGQVAGGVAHELRNPLNVIKTSIYYLCNANSPPPEKVREHHERIERQVTSCDKVISAIADFAKLDSPRREAVDVVQIVHETLANQLVPAGIHVVFSGAEKATILADERQLQIVFGNLLRNAFDAMQDGGTVEVKTTVDATAVTVQVRDQGIGISPDKLPRIGEPLFTTKSRGIGLGLAITRSILEKHRATLDAESQLGAGSTFSVRFPASGE